MKDRLLDWFRLDPRSLALFRALLATLVAIDLTQRGLGWTALYSGTGVLPAAEWLYFGVDPWPPAWLADGVGILSPGLIVVGVGACVALAVGWFPRAAALVAWLVLVLLHARNPFVNFGADVLLRMFLLWSCWLPLSSAWAMRGQRRCVDPGMAGQLGLQVQVVTAFVIAGLAKGVDPTWQAGDGVARALDHEFLATEFGRILFEYPRFTRGATYLTPFLEFAGPIALYCPIRRHWIRLLTIGAMGGMCLAFSLGLHVGLFPVAGFVGLVAYLPPLFWDRLGLKTGVVEVHGSGRVARTLAGGFAAAVICFTLVWNVGLWRTAEYRAPWPLEPLGKWLRLEQKWGMFTRLPSTGRIGVVGRLADGSEVDLLADGGPLPEMMAAPQGSPRSGVTPQSMATRLHGIQWRVFFLGMTESAVEQQRRAGVYLRYLCREWNRRESGHTRLVDLAILYEKRSLRTDPSQTKRYVRENLGSLSCPKPEAAPGGTS